MFVDDYVCQSAIERILMHIYRPSLEKSGTNFMSKLMKMNVYFH